MDRRVGKDGGDNADVRAYDRAPRGDEGQELRFATSEGIHRTTVGEVVQLTSHGSYTHVELICGRSFHLSKNLGRHAETLAPFSFYRVHERHFVNLAHITLYERGKTGGKLTLRNGETVPVSRLRRKGFLEAFNCNAITL